MKTKTKKKTNKTEEIFNRAIITDVEVREIDMETRSATFVATTEAPVETWLGPEVLRMKGARMDRYMKNPVVLDSHDRHSSVTKVIGRTDDVKVKTQEMEVTISFAETDLAEEVWKLVEGDFVRALSVGYICRKVLDLDDGETDGKGKSKVTGPARVVTDWELIEISVVSVPADENALKRALQDKEELIKSLEERIKDMSEDKEKLEGQEEVKEEKVKTEPETKEESNTEPAPEPKPEPEKKEEDEGEERKRQIMAITPEGYEQVAKTAIIEGRTLEEAREILLKEVAKDQEPVGPREIEEQGEEKPLDKDQVARSIKG